MSASSKQDKAKHKLRVPRAKKGVVRLLVGTRKGAFRIKSDRERKTWKVEKVWFLGHCVHHAVADPREPDTILIAARTGHLGPTIFRSLDGGKTFKEASKPPAFDPAPKGLSQRTVNHTFLADPGRRIRTQRLVRGHFAAGLVQVA